MCSSPRNPASRPRPRIRSFSPIATRRSRSTLRALGGSAGTGAAGVAAAAAVPAGAVAAQAGAPAGRRTTSTSSPRLGASEWVKSTRPSSTPKRAFERDRRRIEPERGIAAGDDAPVDAAEHLEAVGGEPQPRRRRRVEAGLAFERDAAVAAAGGEPLDPRAAALQGDRDVAVLDVHALQEVAHAEVGAFDRGRCTPARRSARRSPRSRAARRSAASPPAPIAPRCRVWRRAPRARLRSAWPASGQTAVGEVRARDGARGDAEAFAGQGAR